MAHSRRRFLGLLLLAAYALAVTVGGAFHNHGPQNRPDGGCRGQDPCCHACPSESGGDTARGAAADGLRAGPSSSSWGDGGACAVCHFLAQKPLTAWESRELIVAALDRESSPRLPFPPAEAFFSAASIRGPPAVA